MAANKKIIKKPAKKPVDKVSISGQNPPKSKKPAKGKKIAVSGSNPPQRKKTRTS